MWEPKGRVKAYFTTLPCEAAVKLCEDINSDGGDALLMPPTSGGWGPTMGTLRKHNILQEYPSMLDKLWRKAAALRLSMRTRKENHGQRIKTIKEISVSPMWLPEYELHTSQVGIGPKKHWDELEVASIPREAKLYFPQGLRDVWGGP